MNYSRIKGLPLILISTAILLLTSCMTKSPVATEQKTVTAQIADIGVELTYLTRDTLIDRHGSNRYYNQNPFVDYPGLFPRKNVVVFETRITTQESTIEMNIREIELKIGEKSGKATTVLYLRNLWKAYKDDQGWPKIERATRQFMFPDDITIDPDNPALGYMVFPYSYPREGGAGLLTMTFSTPEGDKGTLEIPMQFSEDGADPYAESENTGIFAGNDS